MFVYIWKFIASERRSSSLGFGRYVLRQNNCRWNALTRSILYCGYNPRCIVMWWLSWKCFR